MHAKLIAVGGQELDELLSLMRAYYDFDNLEYNLVKIQAAAEGLISDNKLGKIWLIAYQMEYIGYIAITFGYSLESGGRDAVVDEFYIMEKHRDRGIGKSILNQVEDFLKHEQIKALYLEVDRENQKAKKFYVSQGFESRERFHLMSKSL